MGFPKYREDDLDRRVENRAAVLDEFQPSFTQSKWSSSFDGCCAVVARARARTHAALLIKILTGRIVETPCL